MADKNPVGRPPAIDEIVLAKLEQAFANDLTDEEACLYAGIVPSTLYRYCQNHPEFKERKELLKGQLAIHAKNNLATAVKEGDKETSKWWLERRRKKDFSPRSEITGQEGGPVEITDDADAIAKRVADSIRQGKDGEL